MPDNPSKTHADTGAKTDATSEPKELAWNPARFVQFLSGDITLAELDEIPAAQLHELATLGHRLLKEGRLKDAKAIFKGLVVVDPRESYYVLALGSIAQKEGALGDAEILYTLAMFLDDTSATAYANRGEVRLMQGRTEEGTQDLDRALSLDPDAKELATQRARFLKESMGARKEAAPERAPSKPKGATKPQAKQPAPNTKPQARPKTNTPKPRGKSTKK